MVVPPVDFHSGCGMWHKIAKIQLPELERVTDWNLRLSPNCH